MASPARDIVPVAAPPRPPERLPRPEKPRAKPPPHTSSGQPARQPAPPAVEPARAGTPGSSLPGPVRTAIEASLGVDTSGVRVHADANAAETARMLSARAVAVGPHVFLGRNERPTDVSLMAHEVAHVVQQRGAPRVQLWGRASGDSFEHEAHRASSAVVARQPFTVTQRTTPRVQRFGLSDVLDWLADKANNIPGYRMFTVVIGVNPINGATVERSGANILRAAVEFIPGGHLIVEALEKYGVFEKGGKWLEQQIATLGMTGRMFIDALKEFIDSLGWSDLLHPGRVWDRAKEIFLRPIKQLIDFFVGLAVGILRIIKDAILKPLAKLAEGTPAWDLLLQVLGENPITGEPVPRSAEKMIGGFMKMIGQEEIWNNIKRANAISRAFQWFTGALAGLLAFVRAVPRMFLDALRSLEIMDIVVLPRAFVKVGRAFLGIAGRFFSWALQQVLSLLQIIFEVVAPGAVPYIRKAQGAFNEIIRSPARFIGNLVRAGKAGFDNFRKNFLAHLRKAIVDWLTGSLAGAGIYIPQAFEIREIVKFVLSVLGLTWPNVRSKIVKVIGETAMAALETGFDIVVTLVREGPAAAWEKIKEQLSNLKDMLMEQILSFVKSTIVEIAIQKILSFLSPVGAFIQAIIAIYNTIMFFIERLRQIGRVVMAFIDSIASIAAGNIGTAAARVETTMAGMLSVVVSFLARFVGLGKVSDEVVKIIDKIRAPIDKALDKVVEWIVSMAKRIGRFFTQAVTGRPPATRPAVSAAPGDITVDKSLSMDRAGHQLTFRSVGGRPQVIMASARLAILETLVGSALYTEEHGPKRGPLIAELTQIRTKLKDLGEDWAAATSKSDADKRLAINQWLGVIAGLLQQIGAQYHIPDLEHLGHPSKYVEGNLIKPEYRVEIRTRFYPSGYRAPTLSWFDRRLVQLENPQNKSQFRDEMTNQWELKTTATIDHMHKVVEQWNGPGNNERQDERADYYNDTGNMRIVAHRNNSSDGAMARRAGLRYQPNVGQSFRGPDDNP